MSKTIDGRGAFADLLPLDPNRSALLFKPHRGAARSDEIHVETRSMIDFTNYLSQSVEVPEVDRRLGRVSITLDDQGRRHNWQQVPDGIIGVGSSSTEPDNAAAKIRYRGNWFCIDDSDLASKSTFGLLSQLFALQSGGAESTGSTASRGVTRRCPLVEAWSHLPSKLACFLRRGMEGQLNGELVLPAAQQLGAGIAAAPEGGSSWTGIRISPILGLCRQHQIRDRARRRSRGEGRGHRYDPAVEAGL